MTHKKLTSCLWGALLAFLLGFGGTACMVTGLRLPADLLLLAVGCAVGALIPAICLGFRKGELYLSLIAALSTLLLAFNSAFQEQLLALCYSALRYYNLAYGLPIPDAVDGCTADSQLLPLLFIGGLVMIVAARTVICRKRSFAAVTAALVPLASCLVVTDTVPEAFAIILLIAGLALLMMTQSTRRQSEAQGNRLTAILILPVLAAVLGLFLLCPQGDYSAPEHLNSMQGILDWFAQQLPVVDQTSEGELVISIGGNARQQVNLAQIGRRVQRNTPVMELNTEYTGTLYLRGRDYDVYTGLGWEATQDRTEDYGLGSIWHSDTHAVSIQILGRRGQYYLPCYPTQQQTLTGGMLANPDYVKSYTFEFSTLRTDWMSLWRWHQHSDFSTNESTAPDERYLELPDETRQRAQEIVDDLSYKTSAQLSIGLNDISLAAAIRDYVQSSAHYDLDPGRMPNSEDDFALWFLEDSESGYCVHFATAATVLLRAADIPARYVEGYMVQTTGGETTVVREKTAHAWVEYYLKNIGWVILDPTPAAEETDPITEPTTEPTTAPTSKPTEPSTTPVTKPPVTTSTTPPATTPPSTTEPGGQPQTSQPSETQIIGLPGDSSGTGTSSKWVIPQWFLKLLSLLAGTVATVLLVVGQWLLRRYLRQRRLRRGKPNVQALKRYRETRHLARLCGLPLPDKLTALAEKAKFSQHTLTKEELSQFDTILVEYIQTLREKPWYYRLICRFVFAAY